MTQKRVVLADDHNLVRAGVRKLVEAIPGIDVAGEAEDGLALVEMARSLAPDLVLMDIGMPRLSGLEATARLRETQPNVRVLILSMHLNEEYVRQALRHGAAGYLLKDAAPAELALAVKTVLRGETYLSPQVSKGVMSDYVERLRETEPGGPLTPRRREVLQLVAEGRTSKEIARQLDISVKTVDTHRTELMNQLNIHDVAGLVRYAMRVGLISPES